MIFFGEWKTKMNRSRKSFSLHKPIKGNRLPLRQSNRNTQGAAPKLFWDSAPSSFHRPKAEDTPIFRKHRMYINKVTHSLHHYVTEPAFRS
jgi:hypothetical protein